MVEQTMKNAAIFILLLIGFVDWNLSAVNASMPRIEYNSPLLKKALNCFFDESLIDSAAYFSAQAVKQAADKNSSELAKIVLAASICELGKYDSASVYFSQVDSSFCTSDKNLAPYYYAVKGLILFRQDQWVNSYRILLESLTLNGESTDLRFMALVDRLLGRISMNVGDYTKTLEWFDKSTRLFQKVNLEKSVSINQKMIGRFFVLTGEPKEAINYFQYALNGLKKFNDTIQFFYVYVNLTDFYMVQRNLDVATKYADTCLSISKQLKSELLLAQTLVNKGEIALLKTNFDAAVPILLQAVELTNRNVDTRLQFVAKKDLAKAYFGLKNYKKTFNYLTLALNQANQSKRKKHIRDAHINLSDYYAAINKFDSSLIHLQLANAYRDSLYNSDLILKKQYFEVRSGIEQRDRLIAQKEKEIVKQKARKNYILLSVLFLMGIFITLYLLMINRNKTRVLISNIKGQENERTRISRELHDGVGGSLAAIKMGLELYSTKNKDGHLQILAKQVSDTWQEVRAISHNLLPPQFSEVSLDLVLESYIRNLNQTGKISFSIQFLPQSGWENLQETIQVGLYRIIQELCSNIVKYSDATQVEIQLVNNDNDINLTMEDDGSAFDYKDNGIGYRNLRERIQLLNGNFEKSNGNTKGNTYLVQVPIK